MKEITKDYIDKLREKYTEELSEFMGYEYSVIVNKIDDEYEATVEDLPGCVGYGDTEKEALENLAEYKEIWFLTCFKNGVRPPTPQEAREVFKVLIRLPRELHLKAARTASQIGMSFNSFVIESLRQAINVNRFHIIHGFPEEESEYERKNIYGQPYNSAA